MTDIEQIKSNLRKLKSFHNGSYGADIDRAIKALEAKWIPVSEGLPKVSDCYAVTRKIGDDLITSACYFDKINYRWYNDNRLNYERNCVINVIAWQPLPEPYKAEGSEEEDEIPEFYPNKEYDVKIITRGKCMVCGKELTEGLFVCKECGEMNKQAQIGKETKE